MRNFLILLFALAVFQQPVATPAATSCAATDIVCAMPVADFSDATSVSDLLGANNGSKFSAGVFEPLLTLNLLHHKAKNENPVVKKWKRAAELKSQTRPPPLTKQAGVEKAVNPAQGFGEPKRIKNKKTNRIKIYQNETITWNR